MLKTYNLLKAYWPAIALGVVVLAVIDVTLSSLLSCHPISANPGSGTYSKPNQEECTALNGPIFISLNWLLKRLHKYEGAFVAIFTVVLAIFTGRLWYSTEKLWGATRQLVEGADDTSKRQLRAYVGMDKLTFEVPNENNPNFVFDPNTIGLVHNDFIAVKIRNYGSTPASDVSVFVYAAVSPPHSRMDDTFLTTHDRDAPPTGIIRLTLSRFMLHPNQIEITKSLFNPHAVRDARAGLTTLHVYGRVYYRDIYGRPWRTKFCYQWERATAHHGERFVPYEQYNGEDQIELG